VESSALTTDTKYSRISGPSLAVPLAFHGETEPVE
jgi:hypothetical protein